MQRSSPVDLRKCLRAANMLAQIGVRFVPVPAPTDAEFAELSALMNDKLEAMAIAIEKGDDDVKSNPD